MDAAVGACARPLDRANLAGRPSRLASTQVRADDAEAELVAVLVFYLSTKRVAAVASPRLGVDRTSATRPRRRHVAAAVAAAASPRLVSMESTRIATAAVAAAASPRLVSTESTRIATAAVAAAASPRLVSMESTRIATAVAAAASPRLVSTESTRTAAAAAAFDLRAGRRRRHVRTNRPRARDAAIYRRASVAAQAAAPSCRGVG